MTDPAAKGRTAGDPTPREQDLYRLFDLSLDMLCIAGLDGYFKHVNPAFTRVLGYRAEDLLSKAFVEFVHPDDREATFQAVEQLAQGLDIVDFENRYRAADGSWRWLAWRSTSVPEEGLIFASARDVTDHKRLLALAERQAAELEHSNAELEQFAAIASHDLRAPLRGVRNLADWIEQELPDDASEEVIDYLHTMRVRVDLMMRLVADLLAYSRVGRDTEIVEETDTGELVADVIELLGPPEGFEIVADDDLPTLHTTQVALEQVLRNLIGNAIDHHNRDTARVEVSARRCNGMVQFSVTDDGPGIPAGDHGKAFEMLWSRSLDDERPGTGMGLALVKRIVERVGGRVWIEPSEGKGTTVSFTWPAKMGTR